LERLEPDIGKLICPVLRGGGGGNVVSLLDTMRLTVMGQMAKGLTAQESTDASGDVEKQLERVKRYLWHGNVFRALQGRTKTSEAVIWGKSRHEPPSLTLPKAPVFGKDRSGRVR
jgi:hypothetical protein